MSARQLLLFLALALAPSVTALPGEAAGPGPAAAEAAKLGPESAAAAEFVRRMRAEVTRFGFEEPTAIGPSRAPLPAEWERHLEYVKSLAPVDPVKNPVIISDGSRAGPYFGRYPDFLAVEIADLAVKGTPPEAVHGGRRAVRLSLAGSRDMDRAAIKRRIPLEVDPESAYELAGWVRLENVAQAGGCARLGLEWLDAEGRRIGGEVQWSDPVNLEYARAWRQQHPALAASGWVPVPDFRINRVAGGARAARVWCEACGREPGAWAGFDDLELRRRPKATVGPDPPASSGIFAADEVPALRVSFQGLAAGAGPGQREAPAGYLRVAAIEDLFGRATPALERAFDPRDLRDGGLEELLRLDPIEAPGAYAVQVSLFELDRAGRRTEVARRVVRLAKLAPAPPGGRASPEASDRSEALAAPAGGPERAWFGVEADLHGSDAPGLLAAIERLGIQAVAVRLWRDGPPGGEPGADGRLEKLLQELAARRYYLEGVLAPVPRRVREGLLEWKGARTLYQSEAWKPLVSATAGSFLPYLSAWRLAGASDRSLGEGGFDRLALAREVRAVIEKRGSAAGQVLVLPARLAGPAAPAPPEAAPGCRDLVYLPAETGGRRRFPGNPAPSAGAGGEPAAVTDSREWFLELGELSENLGLSMAAERGQVEDLARKATVLAAAGGGRCFVELADPRKGLLGPELWPRPAYLAWRTLSANLAGTRCLGEFDLAPEARAWAFQRGAQGLVVFWTDGPEREVPVQLGSQGRARLVDITGAHRSLRAAEAGGLAAAELVPLSAMPAMLTDLEPAFIRTRLGFRPTPGARVECRYHPQEVSFELCNYFPADMDARVVPRFPPGSRAVPRFQRLTLKPGELAAVTFAVRPSFLETVGDKDIAVDLYLSAKDRRETFTVTRRLRVESAISLTPNVTVAAEGRTASVGLTAAVARDIQPARSTTDLEVYLAVPGLARARAGIDAVPTGSSRQPAYPFTVTLGARPQTVYAGVRERNGDWFANVEIELPAASAPALAAER